MSSHLFGEVEDIAAHNNFLRVVAQTRRMLEAPKLTTTSPGTTGQVSLSLEHDHGRCLARVL